MFKRYILPFAMIAALTACDKKKSTNDVDAEHAEHADTHENGADDAGYQPSMSGTPGPALDPGETRDIGESFDVTNALSKEQLLETCLDSDASCVVSAGVGASCTHSGCWFTLYSPDNDALVLVEVKDEAFTMPKNAAASDIIARGTLSTAKFSKTQSHYYRSEAARQLKHDAPNRDEAPTEGYVFTIDGAKITKSADAEPADAVEDDHRDHGSHDHGAHDHDSHDHDAHE